jgi:hypothetical protein
MENEKILKLFKNFIGGELNIHGIIAVPVKVDQSDNGKSVNIFFRMFNPDDVSYFSPVVEDYILEETDEFGGIINRKIDVYFVPDFKTGLYLNKELKSKIQKVFDSVKEIRFTLATPFFGYEKYKLFIESIGVTTATWGNDNFYILNNVKVIRAEKNGEWWDPEVVKNNYTNEFLPEMESYWETEELYGSIDEILNEYPLLDNTNEVATLYETKFVN